MVVLTGLSVRPACLRVDRRHLYGSYVRLGMVSLRMIWDTYPVSRLARQQVTFSAPEPSLCVVVVP